MFELDVQVNLFSSENKQNKLIRVFGFYCFFSRVFVFLNIILAVTVNNIMINFS